MIKALILDLDGTLLRNKDHLIDDFTVKKLNEMSLRGIFIILASGRQGFEVMKKFRLLNLKEENSYCIGSCGAEVISCKSGICVHGKYLSKDAVNYVLDYSHSKDFAVEMCMEDKLNGVFMAYSKPHPYHSHALKKEHLIPYDKMKEYSMVSNLSKVLICVDPTISQSEIRPYLNNNLPVDAECASSKPCFLEIVPKGVDKIVALRWLCKNVLHIGLEDCAAVGDTEVDVKILQECGHSFAPLNAQSEAKEAAKVVLPWSCDEDCVGKLIDLYFPSSLPLS